MPTMKMATQNPTNSCAAHCTVIAIPELLNSKHDMTKTHAESVVWPKIQFKKGETSGATDPLAAIGNSDPRKVVDFVNTTGQAITAKLLCDEFAKVKAFLYVDAQKQLQLGGMFNMMKGHNATAATVIEKGVYYNAVFLMFKGPTPTIQGYDGMHNILVTQENGSIYYYNSNEDPPDWVNSGPGDGWMVLTKQNGSKGSYVFTGVCVEIKTKV